MAAMTEIRKLHLRWQKKTGEDMPENIASLPIDQIRKAADWTEKGITVVVPPVFSPVITEAESSLRYWDGESNN
jgi:hypothetical protein